MADKEAVEIEADYLNIRNESAEQEEKPDPLKAAKEAGSVDIPRPLLTMQQAAAFLGKSVRALERSLMGRWGNKLPDGWSAKKIETANGQEWRILPPPGFRVRSRTSSESVQEHFEDKLETNFDYFSEAVPNNKRQLYRPEHSIDQPTIVIDRSQEVENLLRELLVTQKALSEERRLHMEDLRIVAQLQGSMRLLESSANENSRTKSELTQTQKELDDLKREYNLVLNLPWWKRLFGFKRS
ncbi:MAG: hypothetical protein K2X27_25175 [Candidatus Obscuribacterales bacterium]|nr:hypothetical protein [Candidatus Obscuribacterales bacterium]